MYESFYRLKRPPFALAPDPSFLFLSSGHQEALAGLEYLLTARSVVYAALIGAPGLGKSTLVRLFAASLEEERSRALVFSPGLGGWPELLRRIALCVQDGPAESDAAALVRRARHGVDLLWRAGGRLVLIVDEAHLLPSEALENLRLFVDELSYGRDPLKVVLVGPPELEEILAARHPALRQRVGVPLRLAPLRRRERLDYLEARVRQAGASLPEEVFTPGALRLLALKGRGAPRSMNALANLALVEGFARQERPVQAGTARRAVEDLGLSGRQAPILALAAVVLALILTPMAALYLGWLAPTRPAVDPEPAHGFAELPSVPLRPLAAPAGGAGSRELALEARSVDPPLPIEALRGPIDAAPSVGGSQAAQRLKGEPADKGWDDLAVARP